MSATASARESFVSPHRQFEHADEQQRFLADLFDTLWSRYRQRVVWVREYEKLVQASGGTFVNDHIAFRTFACQQPCIGIATVARIFEALRYRAAGCYQFPDKHLSAIHFQHPNGNFPKLFVSELQTWRLTRDTRTLVERAVESHRAPLSADILAELAGLNERPASDRAALLETVAREIQDVPWLPPERSDVQAVNRESQYAAWVLVHGYNVNHFTSLINSHGVAALDDIEKTLAALKAADVPVKSEIEGARGTKLRQSATEAAVIDVAVRDNGDDTTMPWTYAYFELAERGEVTDPETGARGRFEGFLGPQATQLFEMTRVPGVK